MFYSLQVTRHNIRELIKIPANDTQPVFDNIDFDSGNNSGINTGNDPYQFQNQAHCAKRIVRKKC